MSHSSTMSHSSVLSRFNIDALNEMQHEMLEVGPKPNDVVLISPTGSGKTLGFLFLFYSSYRMTSPEFRF